MTVYQYQDQTIHKHEKFIAFRRNINVILLFVFAVNAIFLPADTFELKKIALILLLVCNLDCFLKMRSWDEWLTVLVGFGLTSVAIGWSFLLTGDLYNNIRIGYVGYIVMLYPIIKQYRIRAVRLILHVWIAMAYFVVIMGLLDVIGLISMYDNPYLMWIYHTGNALVGKGSHLPIGYMIFMKTSPMLFLCLAYTFVQPRSFLEPYCFSKLKYVNAAVVTLALVLSGTRANMLICGAFVLFCFVYCKRSRTKQMLWILGMGLLALYTVADSSLFQMVLDVFVRKASSDEVRNGIVSSIFNVWRENPIKLLIGSGFSKTFFNAGRGEEAYNVELSYWNLLRQVGLPMFLAMMVGYLYPAVRMLKKGKNVLIVLGYVCYLAVAYTNPLLHSSTGMTVLLFMYCLCFSDVDFENNENEMKELWLS